MCEIAWKEENDPVSVRMRSCGLCHQPDLFLEKRRLGSGIMGCFCGIGESKGW